MNQPSSWLKSPARQGEQNPASSARFPFTNKSSSYIILWLMKLEETEKRHGFD